MNRRLASAVIPPGMLGMPRRQPGARAWPWLLARNPIAIPTIIAWCKLLLAEGGFDERLTVAADQDMSIRLAMRGHLGYLDAPLVRVHATPNSLSGVGAVGSVRQQIAFALPMVKCRVAAQRNQLSRDEIRRIFGERWGWLGYAARGIA